MGRDGPRWSVVYRASPLLYWRSSAHAGAGPGSFAVPPWGAVIVGTAVVDHTSTNLGVVLANALYNCPAWAFGYTGSPWSYTINETLTSGHYYWGAVCGGFANITVTHPIELLYP